MGRINNFKNLLTLIILSLLFPFDLDSFKGFSSRKKESYHKQSNSKRSFFYGDGTKFRFSLAENFFDYKSSKSDFIRLIANSPMYYDEPKRICFKVKEWDELIDALIRRSIEMNNRELKIDNEQDLIIFNQSIEDLNSFFSEEFSGLVDAYKLICKNIMSFNGSNLLEDELFITQYKLVEKLHLYINEYLSSRFEHLERFLKAV